MINKDLIYKRRELCKNLENRKITKDEYDREFTKLTSEIHKQFREISEANKVEIKADLKKKIYTAKELKKEVAQYLYELMKDIFSEDEIKGVFRAGYKMLR